MCKLGMEQSKLQTNRDPQAKLDTDNISEDKTNKPHDLNSSTRKTYMTDYFDFSNNKEADKRVSMEITNRIHNKFNDLFSGMRCFEGKFPLHIKKGSCPYQGISKKSSLCTAKTTKAGMAREGALLFY